MIYYVKTVLTEFLPTKNNTHTQEQNFKTKPLPWMKKVWLNYSVRPH